MDVNKLIADLTDILDKDPKVKALVLAGSFARQLVYKAERYSDVEAYIVVEDDDVPVIESGLPGVVSKLGNVIFFYKNQWAGFSTVFEDDLFRLELPIAKLSEMSTVFNRPKAQVLKVLFDKTDGALEKVLDQRPETVDWSKKLADKIPDFWYMAIVGVQYLKKGELWNSITVLRMLQSGVIKFWELQNDPAILLLEPNKRIEKFLTTEQLANLKATTPNHDQDAVKSAYLKVLDIFSQVSPDHEIEDKVKPGLLELLE